MRSNGVLASSVFALGALLAACATPPNTPERMPERATAFAHPEPDPACRATVRDSLAANGLERVVVKVAREPDGRVHVVDFLSPDLTPAAKVELTRAYGQCMWTPALTPAAAPEPQVWTDTIERNATTTAPPPAR